MQPNNFTPSRWSANANESRLIDYRLQIVDVRQDGADAADADCYTSLFRTTERFQLHNRAELPPRNDTVENYLDGSIGTENRLQVFDIERRGRIPR